MTWFKVITLMACDTRYGNLNVECCDVMNMIWI